MTRFYVKSVIVGSRQECFFFSSVGIWAKIIEGPIGRAGREPAPASHTPRARADGLSYGHLSKWSGKHREGTLKISYAKCGDRHDFVIKEQRFGYIRVVKSSLALLVSSLVLHPVGRSSTSSPLSLARGCIIGEAITLFFCIFIIITACDLHCYWLEEENEKPVGRTDRRLLLRYSKLSRDEPDELRYSFSLRRLKRGPI
jgi:hypothetical protein